MGLVLAAGFAAALFFVIWIMSLVTECSDTAQAIWFFTAFICGCTSAIRLGVFFIERYGW